MLYMVLITTSRRDVTGMIENVMGINPYWLYNKSYFQVSEQL